jgi:hypothetical protein
MKQVISRALLVSSLAFPFILKMEVIYSSETSLDFQRNIRRYNLFWANCCWPSPAQSLLILYQTGPKNIFFCHPTFWVVRMEISIPEDRTLHNHRWGNLKSYLRAGVNSRWGKAVTPCTSLYAKLPFNCYISNRRVSLHLWMCQAKFVLAQTFLLLSVSCSDSEVFKKNDFFCYLSPHLPEKWLKTPRNRSIDLLRPASVFGTSN